MGDPMTPDYRQAASRLARHVANRLYTEAEMIGRDTANPEWWAMEGMANYMVRVAQTIEYPASYIGETERLPSPQNYHIHRSALDTGRKLAAELAATTATEDAATEKGGAR